MKVGMVLMASGFGVRFGANKLLQEVEGVPMFRRAFAALPSDLFARAVVVSSYPEILTLASERGYLPLPNSQAADGQSASIRIGLAELLDMDGVLFAVCDQPWLSLESVKRLLSAFAAFPNQICSLSWQGKRGNPVIFPAEFFPELLNLAGDQGGSKVIRANAHRLYMAEADSLEELQDVDTLADLKRLT